MSNNLIFVYYCCDICERISLIFQDVESNNKEEQREEWDRPIEFILSLVGCSVGMYKNIANLSNIMLVKFQVWVMCGDILTLVSDDCVLFFFFYIGFHFYFSI